MVICHTKIKNSWPGIKDHRCLEYDEFGMSESETKCPHCDEYVYPQSDSDDFEEWWQCPECWGRL